MNKFFMQCKQDDRNPSEYPQLTGLISFLSLSKTVIKLLFLGILLLSGSCLNQGKEVIDCVNRVSVVWHVGLADMTSQVVRSVDAKCPAQLTAYARCMDKNHCHFEKVCLLATAALVLHNRV